MYKKGDRVVNGFTPYIHTLPKYIFKGNTLKIRYTTPVLKRRRSTTLTESKEGGCWRRNKRIFRTQRVHPQSTSSISLAWSRPKQCYLCLESSFIGQKSCTLWIQTRVRDNSSHHEDANGCLWTRGVWSLMRTHRRKHQQVLFLSWQWPEVHSVFPYYWDSSSLVSSKFIWKSRILNTC